MRLDNTNSCVYFSLSFIFLVLGDTHQLALMSCSGFGLSLQISNACLQARMFRFPKFSILRNCSSVLCDLDELGMAHVQTRLDTRLVSFDRCFGAQLHALLQTSAGAGWWCWWRRRRRWCPRPTRHGCLDVLHGFVRHHCAEGFGDGWVGRR